MRCRELLIPFLTGGLITVLILLVNAASLATEPNPEVVEVGPGTTIHQELGPGELKKFEVSVDGNKLLHFSVEKGDLCLVTRLFDSSGTKVVEHISQSFEKIEISFPILQAGKYRIELQSREKVEPRRTVDLRIEPLADLTERNRKDSEARQKIAQASVLRADWTEASLRQAINLYDEAERIWSSISDLENAAVSATESGNVCAIISEFSEALRRYQTAVTIATRAGKPMLKARALSQTALVQSYQGNNNLAHKTASEALALLPNAQDAENNDGVALSNLGEVDQARGNWSKATQEFEEAVKILQIDRKAQAKAYLSLGNISGTLGVLDKATNYVDKALTLNQQIGNKVGEGLSLGASGLVHTAKLDAKSALDSYRKASEIFSVIGDRRSEAIAQNSLGQSYQTINELPTALTFYEKSLQLFELIGAHDGAVSSTFKIAQIYSSNRNDEQALKYYNICLQMSRTARKSHYKANVLKGIADIYLREDRYALALAQIEKVLRFYQSIGDYRGQTAALNSHGDLFLRRSQNEAALNAYSRALPLSEKVQDKGLQISTLVNLARANLRLDRPESAYSLIQRALKMIDDLRADVGSPEAQASFISGQQAPYELCFDILRQLDQKYPGKGYLAEALFISEKNRARSLRDLINQVHANVRQDVSTELLDREVELRGLIRIQAQYQIELSLDKSLSTEYLEATNQLNQLRATYQETIAQLRDHNTDRMLPQISVAQIQEQLKDGSILLEYVFGEQHTYLFAVTSNTLNAYELPPRKDIDAAALDVYSTTTRRQQVGNDYQAIEAADKDLQAKATGLSEMILGPAAHLIGAKRLIIVAEGSLQFVPFEALPNPASSTRSPLIESNEVVILSSMSTLLAIRARSHQSSGQKVLAVIADPVFSRDDARVENTLVNKNSSANNAPARLAHAAEEADAISKDAPWGTTSIFKGFDATREVVMSPAISKHEIVHFATHAFVDSEQPEVSSIALTNIDRNGVEHIGLLSLQDIYRLNLSSELTVLSACQTALGKSVKGEGLVGLTHAFISAGSNSVVASLWKVDDRATELLMAEFYDGMLHKDMTPSSALRSAKLKLMKDNNFKEPYYWAGFVLQGEYNNHIVVEKWRWPRIVILILVSGLLLTGVLILRIRRRLLILSAQLTTI
jgi:CHAT domain-containing protein